jgi:cytochrome c55X
MPEPAGAAAVLMLVGLQAGAPTPERQAELLHRLKHDCGSCHGMTLKGGLGPSLLPEALAGKDSDGLAAIVRHGVPGTPMPPWGVEVSAAEAAWLVERLKRGIAP